ncbi:MAG: ankyrin repeat domain-containing protein [Pseudomonadota bacterium]
MSAYHEPLFKAAARGDTERVLALLPADVSASDLRNRDGTSLILQCLYSRAEITLAQLLALFPERPLHEAAALGDAVRVGALIANNQDIVNLLSPDGWTALHLAAFFGHRDTVGILLDGGADPHLLSRAFEINIPLQAACAAGATDAALALVAATTLIDETGPSGTTALMSAAHNGMTDVVDALLAKGAELARLDTAGKSARDYAVEAGHQDLADRLRSP